MNTITLNFELISSFVKQRAQFADISMEISESFDIDFCFFELTDTTGIMRVGELITCTFLFRELVASIVVSQCTYSSKNDILVRRHRCSNPVASSLTSFVWTKSNPIKDMVYAGIAGGEVNRAMIKINT